MVAEICQAFPSLSLDACFDLNYDQIGRLYEAAARLRHEAQRQMAQAVALGIGLAFDKDAQELPSWEDLKGRAKQREKFLQNIFVVKGRQSLASSKTATPDSG